MALKLVLVGIAAGLASATGVIAFGGGFGLAMLGYIGGGMLGVTGGLASDLLPKERVTIKMPRDLARPGTNTRHST